MWKQEEREEGEKSNNKEKMNALEARGEDETKENAMKSWIGKEMK